KPGRSTSRKEPPRSKKLISCVRPGVEDARARFFRLTSAFSNVDLPTFDRPAKAISVGPSGGSVAIETTPSMKSHWPLKRMRPFSIASSVTAPTLFLFKRRFFPAQERQGFAPGDLDAVAFHDDILLRHREDRTPEPVEDEPR